MPNARTMHIRGSVYKDKVSFWVSWVMVTFNNNKELVLRFVNVWCYTTIYSALHIALLGAIIT